MERAKLCLLISSDTYRAGPLPIWTLMAAGGLSAAALTVDLSIIHTAYTGLHAVSGMDIRQYWRELLLEPGAASMALLVPSEVVLGVALAAAAAPPTAAHAVVKTAREIALRHCLAGCTPVRAVSAILLATALCVGSTSSLASWLTVTLMPFVVPEHLLTPYVGSVFIVPAVLATLCTVPAIRLFTILRGI